MARITKAERERDARINAAFRDVGDRVTINLLDIPKVFAAGERAIADGCDDVDLRLALLAFVDSIRVDRKGK